MAATGIELMSTKLVVMSWANELTATRRPFTRTSVASEPRPRRLTPAAPLAVESWLLPRVENVPAPTNGCFSSSCCRFMYPDFAMSSCVKETTGDGFSKSDVLAIREPVT